MFYFPCKDFGNLFLHCDMIQQRLYTFLIIFSRKLTYCFHIKKVSFILPKKRIYISMTTQHIKRTIIWLSVDFIEISSPRMCIYFGMSFTPQSLIQFWGRHDNEKLQDLSFIFRRHFLRYTCVNIFKETAKNLCFPIAKTSASSKNGEHTCIFFKIEYLDHRYFFCLGSWSDNSETNF